MSTSYCEEDESLTLWFVRRRTIAFYKRGHTSHSSSFCCSCSLTDGSGLHPVALAKLSMQSRRSTRATQEQSVLVWLRTDEHPPSWLGACPVQHPNRRGSHLLRSLGRDILSTAASSCQQGLRSGMHGGASLSRDGLRLLWLCTKLERRRVQECTRHAAHSPRSLLLHRALLDESLDMGGDVLAQR